jgi:hypothetical protein
MCHNSQQAGVFVIVIQIFTGKDRSIPLELNPVRAGSGLVWQYLPWVAVTGINKLSCLLHYVINFGCKKFYSKAHRRKIFVAYIQIIKLLTGHIKKYYETDSRGCCDL